MDDVPSGPSDYGAGMPWPSSAQGATSAGSDPEWERRVLSEAQELVQVGAWEWDVVAGRLWWSDQVFLAFGLVPRQVPPSFEGFLQAIHPEDRPDVYERIVAALAGREEYNTRHRIVRPDGEVRYVRERGQVTWGPDGVPVRVLGMVLDVTEDTLLQQERDAAVAALEASEARYRLLAENAYDVVWTIDPEGRTTFLSPSVERVRGLSPAEAAAQPPDEIHPPESLARIEEYFVRLRAAAAAGADLPLFHGELEFYRADGSIGIGETQVVPQVGPSGGLVQIIGVTRDITAQRRFEAELMRRARIDELTGLLNRAEGLDRLQRALTDRRRHGPRLAVAFCDLDSFKEVNDTLGHDAGDALLQAAAARIQACVRSGDLVIRMGGDEVLVVLDGVHDLDEAVAVAEKIRTVMAVPLWVGGRETITTLSVGVTLAVEGDTIDALVARADDAMYEAKSSGRNRVVAATELPGERQ